MDAPHPKVLLLADRFEVRGTSSYTIRLASNLSEYGFEPHIVTSDASTIDPVHPIRARLSEYGRLATPIWGRFVLEMLARDLAGTPPDLIHIQSRGVLRVGTWLARRLKRPFLLTVPDHLPPRRRLAFDTTWGQKIIAVSNSVKESLLRDGGIRENLVDVIASGVELEDQSNLKPVLKSELLPVIGTAGPLEAMKGTDFFLRAAAIVHSTHPNVQFLVSGAGPEEHRLRSLVGELNLRELVTFVPNLYDFSKSLRALDIFCLPSLVQGLGTIMLEAMALAKPVIATHVGGVESIVQDNVNALVVPPGDTRRLAERMVELLNDPAKAQTIGTAARSRVAREFSVQRMLEQTAALYRHILDPTSQELVSVTFERSPSDGG